MRGPSWIIERGTGHGVVCDFVWRQVCFSNKPSTSCLFIPRYTCSRCDLSNTERPAPVFHQYLNKHWKIHPRWLCLWPCVCSSGTVAVCASWEVGGFLQPDRLVSVNELIPLDSAESAHVWWSNPATYRSVLQLHNPSSAYSTCIISDDQVIGRENTSILAEKVLMEQVSCCQALEVNTVTTTHTSPWKVSSAWC